MIEFFNLLSFSLYFILFLTIIYMLGVFIDGEKDFFEMDFPKANGVFMVLSITAIIIEYLIVR